MQNLTTIIFRAPTMDLFACAATVQALAVEAQAVPADSKRAQVVARVSGLVMARHAELVRAQAQAATEAGVIYWPR